MARFTDRVTIVTGAGSGLGRATAQRLASEGALVGALDVADGPAKDTAAQIEADGHTARPYVCDVSDWASVEPSVAKVANDLGRPELLVNCAGVGQFVRSEEETPENWARILGVNLTGTFLMCRAVLPHLLGGGGVIVNTASNAGLMGQPYSAAYCASKGGVVNLTRALADEYLRRGVRVNCIAPGGMHTPLQKAFHQLPDGADGTLLAKLRTPLGTATPEEVAALVAFVASDDGRYMTGSIVSIDGGLTI